MRAAPSSTRKATPPPSARPCVHGTGSPDGGLTKIGNGTLTLAGTNNFNGGTTIDGGTLKLGNASALGSGDLTVDAGTLDLAGYSPTVGALGGTSGTITNSVLSPATLITSIASGSSTFGGSISDGAGQVGLIKTGDGTLTLSGTESYSGWTVVAGGTLAVASTAVLDVGNVYAGGLGGNGVITQADGSTVTLIGNSYLSIGPDAGTTGAYTVGTPGGSGAVLNAPRIFIGNNTQGSGGGLGAFVVNSGAVATNQMDMGAEHGYSNGSIFTINGGSFTDYGQFVVGAHGSSNSALQSGGSLYAGIIFLGGYSDGTGTGTYTQTGGTTTTGNLNFGGSGPNWGVYNLDGGVLNTQVVANSGYGTATFNFDGGTLQAGASNGSFMAGLNSVNVQENGGTIDTQGYSVTIPQVLAHGGVNTTDGGLTKVGSGTLILSEPIPTPAARWSMPER